MTQAGVGGVAARSIRGDAVRASAWSMGAFAAGNAMRLVSNVLLAYALRDNIAALGLMALVHAFNQGLRMFSDVGTTLSVVQNRRGSEGVFIRTAWTIQVIRGACLWVVCLGLAWPYAAFYGRWELISLLPVTGVAVVLSGLFSPGLLQAQRRMDVKRFSMVEVGSQLIALVATLAWAFVAPSVWALAGGVVIGAFGKLAMSYVLTPSPHARFHIDRECARSIMRFGGWIFVSTALTFLATQMPMMAFGKAFGVDQLGVFGVAFMLAAFPGLAMLRLGGQVVFPAYARVVNRGGDLASVIGRVRRPVLTGAGLATGVTYAAAPAFVELVYPHEFAAAGWMLRLLAIGTVLAVIAETSKAALLSGGKASSTAAGQGAKLLGFAVLLPLGMWLWGLPGFVAGVALSELGRMIALGVLAERRGLPVLRGDLAAIALTGVGCVGGMLVTDWTSSAAGEAGWDRTAAQLTSMAAGCVVPLAVWWRGVVLSARVVRGRDG